MLLHLSHYLSSCFSKEREIGSGTIALEIDGDTWEGVTVTPDSIVIIEGEIDKNINEPTIIEVDTISLDQ